MMSTCLLPICLLCLHPPTHTVKPAVCVVWDRSLAGSSLVLSENCRVVTAASSVDHCVISTEPNVLYWEVVLILGPRLYVVVVEARLYLGTDQLPSPDQVKPIDSGSGVRGCSAWFGYCRMEDYSPTRNPTSCAKTQPWHSMSESDVFGCSLNLERGEV